MKKAVELSPTLNVCSVTDFANRNWMSRSRIHLAGSNAIRWFECLCILFLLVYRHFWGSLGWIWPKIQTYQVYFLLSILRSQIILNFTLNNFTANCCFPKTSLHYIHTSRFGCQSMTSPVNFLKSPYEKSRRRQILLHCWCCFCKRCTTWCQKRLYI